MNPTPNTQLPQTIQGIPGAGQGMPMPQGQPLQQILDTQLRANHLPDPISFWPIAPGWWILVALIVLASSAGIYFYLNHRKKTAFRREALQRLEELPTTQQFPAKANILLKQVCLSHPLTPDYIAGATGGLWKNFLMETGHYFDENKARLLTTSAYQENAVITPTEIKQLKIACETWIKNYNPNNSEPNNNLNASNEKTKKAGAATC